MNSVPTRLWDHYLRVQQLSTDSRNIAQGDIFFALKGPSFNGNIYAAQAIEKGASMVVIDDADYAVHGDDRYVLVGNVLKSLQQLAINYRKLFHIPVLGLTGSNGKTTTKELIQVVLATEKKVHATSGNFNNHIGVPLSILAMPKDTEIAIIEMGANQPNDIWELVHLALPNYGMITNIGAAHLERFGSLEGVQKTKGELFDYLRLHRGKIFLNQKDSRVKEAARDVSLASTYGLPTSDTTMEILSNNIDGLELSIRHKDWQKAEFFKSAIAGEYNAMNILAAITVGQHFGISIENMKKGISQYVSQNNRSQLVKVGNTTVWLDAYNANPTSMHASIANAFHMQKGKVALVLGDMLELGTHEQKAHQELGAFIQSLSPFHTVLIGPLMQYAKAELGENSHWFQDAEAAQAKVKELLATVDLLLIKGSRGMALEKLIAEAPTETH